MSELFLPLQYGGLEAGVGGWEALPHPSNLYAHGSGKKTGLRYCVLLSLLQPRWVPGNM